MWVVAVLLPACMITSWAQLNWERTESVHEVKTPFTEKICSFERVVPDRHNTAAGCQRNMFIPNFWEELIKRLSQIAAWSVKWLNLRLSGYPSSSLHQAAWPCCCHPRTAPFYCFSFSLFYFISHSLGVDRETSSGCFSRVFLCTFYGREFEFQAVLFIFLSSSHS